MRLGGWAVSCGRGNWEGPGDGRGVLWPPTWRHKSSPPSRSSLGRGPGAGHHQPGPSGGEAHCHDGSRADALVPQKPDARGGGAQTLLRLTDGRQVPVCGAQSLGLWGGEAGADLSVQVGGEGCACAHKCEWVVLF